MESIRMNLKSRSKPVSVKADRAVAVRPANGRVAMGIEAVTERLINRAAALDMEVREKSAELRVLKDQLAILADYRPGSRTGHLTGRRYAVKVQRRDNVRWNQEALAGQVRPALGDRKFFELFRCKYEPNVKELDGFLSHGDPGLYGLIIDARTVEPGSPQVSFELLL